LGTVPFKITVGELKEKVSVWTEPPEQPYFVDGQSPFYTWFPWDDFLQKRSEERFFLDPKQPTLAFDATSSYWWRFEYQGVKAACYASRQRAGVSFDGNSYYSFDQVANIVFPSTWVHTDLLVGVLEDDGGKPSPEWIDYAAERTGNLVEVLYNNSFAKITNPAILTAIAKRRYGLSETPTPEECDKAIERILKESKNRYYFTTYQDSSRYYLGNCDYFGENSDCRDTIVKHAIRAMGPACKEPLLRHFRASSDMNDYQVRPIGYMLGEYCFPELFEEIFCRYAMERQNFRNLMNYPDERLVPLLQTLLAPEVDFLPFFDGSGEDKRLKKVKALLAIENKLLEPTIRAYLAKTLPKINESEQLLDGYVATRTKFDGADREEIAQWIESLRIDGRYKSAALQELRYKPKTNETLGQHCFEGGGPLEQTLTETFLKEWIEKNPDRMLEDLIIELDPKRTDDAEEIKGLVIRSVIHRDKPEAKDIITMLWKKQENQGIILSCTLSYNYVPIIQKDASGTIIEQRIRLPGTYTNMNVSNYYFRDVLPQAQLPEYFVALFDELNDPKVCVNLPDLLSNVETPEAVALLTKWSQSESSLLKRRASESLEFLSLRMKLKTDRRRLFADLVSGKITPDDLLLPTKPFVWKEGKYVEKL
jgi:hypothetical protein